MDGQNLTRFIWLFRVSYRHASLILLRASHSPPSQDCNDRNPVIRALAIRTMSYIPIPVVTESMTEQLRHCLKDKDPYVRKTAAVCVAKLYATDPRKAERGGFVEMLRDLLVDPNPTVVSNAVAALSEIGDKNDGVTFKLNFHVANKLLTALGESSEYVSGTTLLGRLKPKIPLQMGSNLYFGLVTEVCPGRHEGRRNTCRADHHTDATCELCRGSYNNQDITIFDELHG